MNLSMLIAAGILALIGIGFSWVYVKCNPNYPFPASRLSSAPSLSEVVAILDKANDQGRLSSFDINKIVDLYQRLTQNRYMYQEVKADYEETFGESPRLHLFFYGLVIPLLVFKDADGFAFIPAGIYAVSYILGCVVFRKLDPTIVEDSHPFASSEPHVFDSPAAFIKYWENVDAVQWSYVSARRDNVYQMKKEAAAAKFLFTIALIIFAFFGTLGIRHTVEQIADPDYCHQASYDKGYAAGEDDGYDDGYEDGQREARIRCPVDIDECAQAYTGLNTAVTDLELYFDEGVRYDVNELYWNIENARLTFWELCDFIARHWG